MTVDYQRLLASLSLSFWVSSYVCFSILVLGVGKRGIKGRLVGKMEWRRGLTSITAWNPTTSLPALTVTVFHPSVSVPVSSGSVGGEEVMICIND